jgi:truncated hemoglobin YjbI/quinol monooxygenase YgiN
MIVEYIRYRVQEHEKDAFEAAYRRAAVPLAAAPECVDYELTVCEDEPVCYVLRITWTSGEDHLGSFRGSERFRAFLAEIRPYVDQIEEMRHYAPTGVGGRGAAPADDAAAPTLYEWAGGEAALSRLFEAFYTRVRGDELLAPLFGGMDPEHPKYVALWLGEVLGGPPRYTAERGGYPHMLSRHLGRAITERQRRRWVELLLDTADEVALPGDPEFRAAFVGYVEWGTRLAMANSQPDAAPPQKAPTPRWGWGVAPPWTP